MSAGVEDDRMKCRLCAYTTFKWRTTKDGKRQSGWRNLQEHMHDAHDIECNLIGDADE